MNTDIRFVELAEVLDGADALAIFGRKSALGQANVTCLLPSGVPWQSMLDDAQAGDVASSRSTFCDGDITRVIAGVVSNRCSRHNSPSRADAITQLAKGLPKGKTIAVVLAVDAAEHAMAAGSAVARALPLYSRKTGKRSGDERVVKVAFAPVDGETIDLTRVTEVANAVRFAARLVDMPTSEFNTSAFVDVARTVAAQVGADITVVEGEALGHGGFGGLWGVGKAADDGPALVVLDHAGEGGSEVTLVGKGIVYDTGGLSIKTKSGMPGMKGDMAGAAAVLGAFAAAARLGSKHRVRAVLCIAENAVGPDATRPDDVLSMYSGKTVEVNNTDAEGRLVLADGVAYAVRHLAPEYIIDVATLTGAQLMATGKRHCASICNDDQFEALAVVAGRASGDLVHPLPYCPEFFRKEFKSAVADMKNSVKDRMNGQSSCAAQFVAEHLGDYDGAWLHLDIAGPADMAERGTGFGVALLVELLERL